MHASVEPGLSSREAECFRLGQPYFNEYWPQIEEALRADPELWNHSFAVVEDIYARCILGQIQVWVIVRGKVIQIAFMTQTYIGMDGEGRLLVFWGYGEKLKEMMPLIDLTLDRAAAALDCSRIEGQGRRGFERLVKGLGFEFEYVMYSRPVRAQRGN